MSHHGESIKYNGEQPENSSVILFIRKHRKKILFGFVGIVVIAIAVAFYIVSFVISKIGQINLTGVSQIPTFTQSIQTLPPQNLNQIISIFVSFLNLKQ